MSSLTAPARRTGPLLMRRFAADYARNPVNLLVLVLVPVVFVGVAAGSLAEIAKLLGGSAGGGGAVQTVTAGWAAGFIASIAMYFQVRAARAADRRLVLAGLPARRLASARAVTGLALALLAAAAAVVTLAVRSGISHPGRVLAGTVMFAVICLAIGALTGALVASPVNGTVLIFFVWMADVMFGPVFGSAVRPASRLFPTHFVTLWMIDLPSHHAGRVGDLGWALSWTAGAAILAWAVVTVASRTARARRRRRRGTALDQLRAAIRAGLLDWGRNRVLGCCLAWCPRCSSCLPARSPLAANSACRWTTTAARRARRSASPSAPAFTQPSWPRWPSPRSPPWPACS